MIFGSRFGGWLVVGTLVMVVAYIAFTRIVTDWRNALRASMNDFDTRAVAHAVDSLLNFETVKYFNAEEREAQRYDRAITAYTSAAVKNETSLAWLNIGQALITNVMMAGGMGLVVWGWSQGRFTPGNVVLVSTLLSQLFRPLDLLGMVYRTIRQGLIDMAAMFELIDTPAEIVDILDAPPLVVGRGHVRFEDVRFHYDADRAILKGIDLDVPAGSTLAIVGPSGAGKSTIARLLFRFYDLSGGRITIDGQDIARVQQATLRAAIGIVPQDTVLFNDTIGYNIAYGREGSDAEAVRAAARGAAIDGFIESLPKGYKSEGRRARAQAVGRREAARRDRADPAQGSADPDPRRGDQRARQPHRGRDSRHAARGDAAPHHDHDRAPALDGGRCRSDRRARRRPRRRTRQPCRADGAGRSLCRDVGAPGRRARAGRGARGGVTPRLPAEG